MLASTRIVSGSAHPQFASHFAQKLNLPAPETPTSRFPNKEFQTQLLPSLRGMHIGLIQFFPAPMHTYLVEMTLLIHALKSSGCREITAILPYLPYTRQDNHAPYNAKWLATCLSNSGLHSVITLDAHSPAVRQFFTIPLFNIPTTTLFLDHFQTHQDRTESHPLDHVLPHPTLVIAPDKGGIYRAQAFAKALNLPMVLIDKHKEHKTASILPNPQLFENRHCILIDDILDTGKTLYSTAKRIKTHGAAQITAYVTHGIFSGNALKKLEDAPVDELIITNSLPQPAKVQAHPKIRILNTTRLMSQVFNQLTS